MLHVTHWVTCSEQHGVAAVYVHRAWDGCARAEQRWEMEGESRGGRRGGRGGTHQHRDGEREGRIQRWRLSAAAVRAARPALAVREKTLHQSEPQPLCVVLQAGTAAEVSYQSLDLRTLDYCAQVGGQCAQLPLRRRETRVQVLDQVMS